MLSQMSLRDTITIDIFVLVDNKRKNLNTNIHTMYTVYTQFVVNTLYMYQISQRDM